MFEKKVKMLKILAVLSLSVVCITMQVPQAQAHTVRKAQCVAYGQAHAPHEHTAFAKCWRWGKAHDLMHTCNRSTQDAIRCAFGWRAEQALHVAWCESVRGSGWNGALHAVNGEYVGLFQMGDGERTKYSYGRYTTALDQSLAARRYGDYEVHHGEDFWHPWQCKP